MTHPYAQDLTRHIPAPIGDSHQPAPPPTPRQNLPPTTIGDNLPRRGRPKGTTLSQATKDKISASRKGHKMPNAVRLKIAASMSAKKNTLTPDRDSPTGFSYTRKEGCEEKTQSLSLRPPVGMRTYHPPHRAWNRITLPMHPDSKPDAWVAEIRDGVANLRPDTGEYLRGFLDQPVDPDFPEMLLVEVDWGTHSFILHGFLRIKDPQQRRGDVFPHDRKIQHVPRLLSQTEFRVVATGADSTIHKATPSASPLDIQVTALIFENHIIRGPVDSGPLKGKPGY